jgi:AraC-like DNA-binding protein
VIFLSRVIKTPTLTLYGCGAHVALPETRKSQTYSFPCTDTPTDACRLLLCRRGQTVVRLQKGMYIAKKGDVLLLRGDAACEYRPGAGHHLYYLDLSGASLSVLLPEALLSQGVLSLQTLPAAMLDTLAALLAECYGQAPCAPEAATAHLILLLTALCRAAEGLGDAPEGDITRIMSALASIEQDYAADYSLAEYAQMCGMSEYYFLRFFKTCKGMTPLAYRTAVRMRAARTLLCESDLSITEIAARVGYSDSVHFGKQFKQSCGMTPRDYRKQLREK